MLALRMRQKDSEFYFVSYPAEDLLQPRQIRDALLRRARRGGRRRSAGRRRRSPQKSTTSSGTYAQIERSSGAFQRELNRRKVRQIRDFFRNETDQPVVPGAVLLFTSEELEVQPDRPVRADGRPCTAARAVSDHRRPASARRAALLLARARRRSARRSSVRDLRRQDGGVRDRDVRDHQFHAHSDQQEPHRRSLREDRMGDRPAQEARGATRACAVRRERFAAALSRQHARRALAARHVDQPGAAFRRGASVRHSPRYAKPGRPTDAACRAIALTDFCATCCARRSECSATPGATTSDTWSPAT